MLPAKMKKTLEILTEISLLYAFRTGITPHAIQQ